MPITSVSYDEYEVEGRGRHEELPRWGGRASCWRRVARACSLASSVARTVSLMRLPLRKPKGESGQQRAIQTGLASYVYSRSSVRLSRLAGGRTGRRGETCSRNTWISCSDRLYCKSACDACKSARAGWTHSSTVHSAETVPSQLVAYHGADPSLITPRVHVNFLYVRGVAVYYCALRPGGRSYLRSPPMLRSAHACMQMQCRHAVVPSRPNL